MNRARFFSALLSGSKGTYVAPHYRTTANGNVYDNLSYAATEQLKQFGCKLTNRVRIVKVEPSKFQFTQQHGFRFLEFSANAKHSRTPNECDLSVQTL